MSLRSKINACVCIQVFSFFLFWRRYQKAFFLLISVFLHYGRDWQVAVCHLLEFLFSIYHPSHNWGHQFEIDTKNFPAIIVGFVLTKQFSFGTPCHLIVCTFEHTSLSEEKVLALEKQVLWFEIIQWTLFIIIYIHFSNLFVHFFACIARSGSEVDILRPAVERQSSIEGCNT